MIVKLEEDENGELVLPLPEETLKELGWEIGDTLTWTKIDENTWQLSKK